MSRDPFLERARRRGPLGRLRDVVDRSVGMYAFRRLTGRDAQSVDAGPSPPLLDPDEIAYRIGAAGERPRPRLAHVVASAQPLPAPRVAPASRPPITTADAVRRRLVRDSGIALAGFALVAFLAVSLLPPAQGGVLGATGRPGDQELAAPTPTASPRPS